MEKGNLAKQWRCQTVEAEGKQGNSGGRLILIYINGAKLTHKSLFAGTVCHYNLLNIQNSFFFLW